MAFDCETTCRLLFHLFNCIVLPLALCMFAGSMMMHKAFVHSVRASGAPCSANTRNCNLSWHQGLLAAAFDVPVQMSLKNCHQP